MCGLVLLWEVRFLDTIKIVVVPLREEAGEKLTGRVTICQTWYLLENKTEFELGPQNEHLVHLRLFLRFIMLYKGRFSF